MKWSKFIERARHDSELAKPQNFPLTEDGEATRKVTDKAAAASRDHLATARYRDYKNRRPQ